MALQTIKLLLSALGMSSLLGCSPMTTVAPDIVVKNTSQETYQPIKPDTNIRNSLDIIKRARDKTFNEFEAKLDKLIIKEADDPPALGIRLDLSDEVVDVKPKLKNKKKK